MKTLPTKLTHSDLRQFHGDDVRYRTVNPNVIYTPGIQYLAEHGDAYWLIDAIASYYPCVQMKRAMEKDERLRTLQFWRLDVGCDESATLIARVDQGVEPFIVQKIDYTDFPLDYVDVWAGFGGKLWTLYLPSEH